MHSTFNTVCGFEVYQNNKVDSNTYNESVI